MQRQPFRARVYLKSIRSPAVDIAPRHPASKQHAVTADRPSAPTHLRLGATALAAALLFAAGAAGAAPPQRSAEGPWVKGRLLVVANAGVSEGQLSKMVGVGGANASRLGGSNLFIVNLPAQASETAVLARLRNNPHLKGAELDQLVAPNLVTNDPYAGSQWHLPKIGANAAWDMSQGSGVTIAILDTGVDGAHPDLAPRMVPGWNFYDNNSNTSDVYGHGTRVAGAAAAAANNGIGVASVAGQAKIMPIRISDTSGIGSWGAIAQGITYAADRGVRVANVSYMVASSTAIQSAAQYMKNKGGLVFVSAGNTGVEVSTKSTTTMIPVSATDKNDVRTSWSTFGEVVTLAAPGAAIYSTNRGGGYGSVSGTSFSSPITAGVAALVMAARPTLSSADVEKLLISTAVDLGTPGRDPYYGHGRVDAHAAVLAAINSPSGPSIDTQAPSVAITAPLGSSTVNGVVPVNVNASDNVGVTKVELRVNGSLVATDTTTPFAFSWDTTKVANGTANLVVRAFDAAGNAANSSTVAVNVANTTAPVVADTTPPVVTFVSPQTTSVSGNLTVSVSATDNAGPSGLRQWLYINGGLVASATGGSLNYKWNTNKLRPGTYTLQAVATDASGNSASQSLQVVR